MIDPRTLTDDALIETIARLAARCRETTAELIAHLVVLEERNLHLACGFSSLWGYCHRVLGCSENGSYDRMEAAHAARRFPVVLAMLADGSLHLTALRLLAPHLRDEDHLALLGGARRKPVREIRELLARWFPQPDVPTLVRRLPDAGRRKTTAAPEVGQPAPAAGPPRRVIEPLSPGRHLFRFTGDDETVALLREAQELLSHSIPDGDIAAIVKRALLLVVAEARSRRFAATKKARPTTAGPATRKAGGKSPVPPDPASRHIAAEVERLAWDRDGGQCAFVAPGGRRCEARRFLEFHHLRPWIVGGPPSLENIALRCRAHNRYEATVYFAPIRAAMSDA